MCTTKLEHFDEIRTHSKGNIKSDTFKWFFGFLNIVLIFPFFSMDDAVQSVFTNVSQSYDLMKDMMLFGLHHLWKDHLVKKLSPNPGSRLLDAAGGTGMPFTLNSRISHSLCVGMKLSW